MPQSVLITRPGFADTTSARVAARGFDPIVAPFLTIAAKTVAMPRRAQAVLVTSSNALASLPPGGVRLFAVGDATAERARAHGFADVLSASGDAAALAALVAREADPASGPLVLASGAGQGAALASNLRRRGFRVARRVCYTARPVSHFPDAAALALQSGRLRAAMFLSAETADAFVRLLPPALWGALHGVAALAIGQTTAERLEALPWLRVCRARSPTLDDVLALI